MPSSGCQLIARASEVNPASLMKPSIVERKIPTPALVWRGLRLALEMKKINVEIDRAAAAGLSDLHAKVGVLEISSNIGFVEPAEVYRQAPRHHHAGACDRFTPAQPMRGGWASTLVVMKN